MYLRSLRLALVDVRHKVSLILRAPPEIHSNVACRGATNPIHGRHKSMTCHSFSLGYLHPPLRETVIQRSVGYEALQNRLTTRNIGFIRQRQPWKGSYKKIHYSISKLQRQNDANKTEDLALNPISHALQRMQTHIGDQVVEFETGKLACLANGTALLRMGDTVVLVTAVCANEPSPFNDGMAPITVEYRERASAFGRIPGTYQRRELSMRENEVISSRLIDRALRPLFPAGFLNETQIIANVLAADKQADLDILSLNGASLALCLSDIPFNGPVGAVRVIYLDGQLVVNPKVDDREKSILNLVVAGTEKEILMLEASANECPSSLFKEAIRLAHQHIIPLVRAQGEFSRQYGKPKRGFKITEPSEELLSATLDVAGKHFHQIFLDFSLDKVGRDNVLNNTKASTQACLRDAFPDETISEIDIAVNTVKRDILRNLILDESIRCDGRGLEDIRPLHAEVSILPPVIHGSALFQRGKTQALCTVTIDNLLMAQRVDEFTKGTMFKRLMLHYEFPPFAVNEVRKMNMRFNRREIGHGVLAERALLPVFPSETEFPYAVRLISEILSSNGSSSMATTCGGSLALMDAGVPIRSPVAGVTCGLITRRSEGNQANKQSGQSIQKYRLITDISGIEDHFGDMDFKLAGTRRGITACQLDLKLDGVSQEIIEQAIDQAVRAQLRILDYMDSVMNKSREHRKPSAPIHDAVQINPYLRPALFALGGTPLKNIEKLTGTELRVEDEMNVVSIFARDADALKRAKIMINRIAGEIIPCEIYRVRVVKLTDVGVFVEFDEHPGREGFIHISEFPEAFKSKRVDELYHVDDMISARAIGYDGRGKCLLSARSMDHTSMNIGTAGGNSNNLWLESYVKMNKLHMEGFIPMSGIRVNSPFTDRSRENFENHQNTKPKASP